MVKIKKKEKRSIYQNIKNYLIDNKSFVIISLLYAVLSISVIDWGIPNNQHPFTYHMDEWHQLQSVRATFKYLTPNIEGAAHGTIFHFVLSGIYLAPFYLLRIVDPFLIKSGLSEIAMQAKLFEILRLNTLMFGLLSLFILNEITKKYFKINPIFTLIFFALTPLWINLSNYFKYDIALVFWILMAIFFILKFGSRPSLRNYIYAGIACALALATKLSALPLFPIYFFSFFYFLPRNKRKYYQLLTGLFIFVAVFSVFGIPDVLIGKANYGDFLSSNLLGVPTITNNFKLDYQPWWLYILLVVVPLDFGHIFAFIFFLAVIYWLIKIFDSTRNKKMSLIKNDLLILISFVFFASSLWPLQIGATGNRLLVLLPFLAIMSGSFLHRARKSIYSSWKKSTLTILICIILAFQLLESVAIVYVKHEIDVRQASSLWLIKNIKKGSTIGIENIPIYQLLPDVIVKEFYEKQDNPKIQTNFDNEVIDASTKNLPDVIVISNKEFDRKYLKKSAKNDLVRRLSNERYIVKKEFKPSQILYILMQSELRMYTSGLVPIPTITIYVKSN